MDRLSIETVKRIVAHLPPVSADSERHVLGFLYLISLRLVSKAFRSVVTPIAFRNIVVDSSLQSEEDVAALRDGLVTAFSGLGSFPKLECISLYFFCIMPADDDDVYLRAEFHRFLRSLKSLWITFRCSKRGLGSNQQHIENSANRGFKGNLDRFWHSSMSHILSNATSITALRLGDCDDLHRRPLALLAWIPETAPLTHLTSLELTSLAFPTPVTTALNHEIHNTLGFILLHKATLTELELRGCYILMHESELKGVPLLWHVVFKRFMDELTVLESFYFSCRAPFGPPAGATPQYRYLPLHLDHYKGIQAYEGTLPGQEHDVKALEDLLVVAAATQDRRWAAFWDAL
ncbi:hypothetical protein FB45DRAFT_1005056 [Roridomyces roridus]|uniref:F-box domain-containing protein n=1 Tax=Roridomyces roridus TaxID=1738132 RepID=A0AAD7BMZ3_9AGAR|nr:hypothetical protein FB45DRAFT_1005056 [Roridomyces roridus]